MENLCKNCRFASFKSEVDGSRQWQGKCLVDILSNTDGERMKYHTVMQHFRCSNNKFEPLGGNG